MAPSSPALSRNRSFLPMMKFLVSNVKYFLKDIKKPTLKEGCAGIVKGR